MSCPNCTESYLTEQAVAKILDCSKKTIANMCRAGLLPFIKVGNERRIPESQFQEWLTRQIRENSRDHKVTQQAGTRITAKVVRMQTAESIDKFRMG